jgi:fumarate reductase flavoprotein subunit
VLAQPDAVAWLIYDETVHERALPFDDYQQLIEADGIRWAADAVDLAALIGCDEAAITNTLASVSAYTSGAETDPLGRTLWPHALETPIAAVKVTGALFHTQGGLSVDGNANVLRNGEPIPGLYAAGGAAAGISGNGAAGYLSGNGLLSALGLGFIAGRTITGG